MSLVIVVQARMRSSRLPGKVMLEAAGQPLLAHMITRVRGAKLAERVVVATTTAPDDDVIEQLCRDLQVDCFRGHPTDCLDRHYQAALAHDASTIVKIPSDCILIDPEVIDRVLSDHRATRGQYDYVSNQHPATWPDGNDVEVLSMQALRAAWQEATDPFDREHTTPYIWQRPEQFSKLNVLWDTGLDYSQSHRWVVDWDADYQVVRELIETLSVRHGPLFNVSHILQLLTERPELAERNAQHRGYLYYGTRSQTHA